MKLDPVIHNDVIMSKPLEEQTFGIAEEDVGVIIEILRDKLYSNKRKIVVQEYMCNARDAHREVDNEATPVTVKLPNVGCPTFEVRDFGPGITPERMATVFVRYGASTKRADDDQTGGYGIGAKSAWSYCDQFGIVTYVDGTERHYSAFLDDGESERGRVGKVALLHECDTKEPNGTKIVVPIKVEDFQAFINYAKETAEFWEVRPTFTGVADGEIIFPEHKYLEEGKNWKLIKGSWRNSNTSFVIVDGIQYPVQMNELEGLDSISNNILERDKVHIYFNTGEVSISANREALYYNEKTKNAIASRLKEMTASLSEKIGKTVKKCKTWVEAKNTWCELCHASTVAYSMGKFEWRTGKFVDNTDIYANSWGEWRNIHIQRWTYTNNEVTGSKRERLSFPLKNDIIVVNDAEKFPSKPRLLTLFKGRDVNNPEFNGIITISSVKRGIHDSDMEDKELKKKLKTWTKQENLNGKEITKLSKVEKTKTARGGGGAGVASYNDGCVTVKKITLDTWGYPSAEKVRLDLSVEKGVWVSVWEGALEFNKDLNISLDKGNRTLQTIMETTGVKEFYAVPQRMVYKVTSPDMKPFDDVFVEAVKKKVNKVGMKFKNANITHDMEKMSKVGLELKKGGYIDDEHSLRVFGKNIKTYEEERQRNAAIDRLVKMTAGRVDMKLVKDATAYDFASEYKDLVNTYPMLCVYLKRTGYYNCALPDTNDRKVVSDYIAMMDLMKEDNATKKEVVEAVA